MKMAAVGADWSKRLIKTREGERGEGEGGRGGEMETRGEEQGGRREGEKPASTALII